MLSILGPKIVAWTGERLNTASFRNQLTVLRQVIGKAEAKAFGSRESWLKNLDLAVKELAVYETAAERAADGSEGDSLFNRLFALTRHLKSAIEELRNVEVSLSQGLAPLIETRAEFEQALAGPGKENESLKFEMNKLGYTAVEFVEAARELVGSLDQLGSALDRVDAAARKFRYIFFAPTTRQRLESYNPLSPIPVKIQASGSPLPQPKQTLPGFPPPAEILKKR